MAPLHLSIVAVPSGLPSWLRGKESACDTGDTGSVPEEGMAPTPGLLPGKPHGQRSLAGYVHGVAEWDMTEVTEHALMPYHQLLSAPADFSRE